jgi:hypothetical protein
MDTQHINLCFFFSFTSTTYKKQHYSQMQGTQAGRKCNHIPTIQQIHTTSVREGSQRNTSVQLLQPDRT